VLIGENTENPLRRGKEIITLDLKAANGVIAALDLIADADALIEGNRPGVMERLGLGPPYDFTANSALEISSRISSLPAGLGLVTPSLAFGADFVLSLPGCFRTDIPSCGTDLPRQSQ
jgi:hypothetical protein